jgi:hypothetical protein
MKGTSNYQFKHPEFLGESCSTKIIIRREKVKRETWGERF